MAKAWRATTTIKAGQIGTFLRGDIVTGLTKENMKQLWESGALEKVEVEEVPAPAPAPTPKPENTEPSKDNPPT